MVRNKKKCRCGSLEVVYVVQKGRGKTLDYFCSDCLPVEAVDNPEPEKRKTESEPFETTRLHSAKRP